MKIINLLSNSVFTIACGCDGGRPSINILLEYGYTLNVITFLIAIPIIVYIIINEYKRLNVDKRRYISDYGNIYHKIGPWTGWTTKTWWLFWMIFFVVPGWIIATWFFGFISTGLLIVYFIYWIIYYIDNPDDLKHWWNNKAPNWLKWCFGTLYEPDDKSEYKSKLHQL